MWIHHGVKSFRNRLLQSGFPAEPQVPWKKMCSLHGSTDPVRSLLQYRLSMCLQILSGHIHLLWCEILHKLQVDICSTYRGIIFSTECREISAVVPEATPPPPSSLALESAEVLLSHILIPLIQLLLWRRFSLLPNYISQRHYHCHWSAWPWPVADPS